MEIIGRSVLQKAVDRYGHNQRYKAKEELQELLDEIEKYNTAKEYNQIDEAGYYEEMADALIMIYQLMLLHHAENVVTYYYCLKVHKLQQRLERDAQK